VTVCTHVPFSLREAVTPHVINHLPSTGGEGMTIAIYQSVLQRRS